MDDPGYHCCETITLYYSESFNIFLENMEYRERYITYFRI